MCGGALTPHAPAHTGLPVSASLTGSAVDAPLQGDPWPSSCLSVPTQAMFELVTSEASYYKSLSLLVSHFMENERLKKILHPSEAHILFSNVLDVMAVSER